MSCQRAILIFLICVFGVGILSGLLFSYYVEPDHQVTPKRIVVASLQPTVAHDAFFDSLTSKTSLEQPNCHLCPRPSHCRKLALKRLSCELVKHKDDDSEAPRVFAFIPIDCRHKQFEVLLKQTIEFYQRLGLGHDRIHVTLTLFYPNLTPRCELVALELGVFYSTTEDHCFDAQFLMKARNAESFMGVRSDKDFVLHLMQAGEFFQLPTGQTLDELALQAASAGVSFLTSRQYDLVSADGSLIQPDPNKSLQEQLPRVCRLKKGIFKTNDTRLMMWAAKLQVSEGWQHVIDDSSLSRGFGMYNMFNAIWIEGTKEALLKLYFRQTHRAAPGSENTKNMLWFLDVGGGNIRYDAPEAGCDEAEGQLLPPDIKHAITL